MILDFNVFLNFMSSSILVLLIAALAIFVWLAAMAKSIRSFQFQISIFIIIWIVGEIADKLHNAEIISIPAFHDLGAYIHLGSMAFLGIMLWARYYYSYKSGRKMIDYPESR